MKINFRFILFFVVFVGALFSLGSGANFLNISLLKNYNFPIGTLIAWFGIISIPITIFYGSKSLSKPKNKTEKIFNRFLKYLITLNCLWGFLSYLLAANWSFSFSDQPEFRGSSLAFEYFKIMTIVLVSLPLILGVLFAINKTIETIKKQKITPKT